MRNRISIIAAVLATCMVVACGGNDSKDIVIGGVLPLTGDAGTFGQNAANGARLAVDQANENKFLGDGVTIRWVAEDSRGAPADAVSAARKLISVQNARALVGDVTSSATNALIPIVTAEKVVLISPSASDPALSGASEYFARVWPSDVYEARVIGEHALSHNFSKIAVLYANTDYGVGMVKSFKGVVGTGRVALEVPFPEEFSDFRAVLQRCKAAGADALFLVAFPETGRIFLEQLDEAGMELPILATASIEDPKVASAPRASQITFASPAPPADSDEVRSSFIKEYKAKYGQDPGVLSDMGYDAARLILESMKASGGDTLKATQWIRGLKAYQGASGRLSFESNGDVVREYRLKRVANGAFVFVD